MVDTDYLSAAERYLKAIIDRRLDDAMDCLSPGFAIHKGMTATQKVASEMREMTALIAALGSPEAWGLDINIIGTRSFRADMTGPAGDFIGSVFLQLDEDGRVVGDGSPYEIVPKLAFEMGAPALRACAVRSRIRQPFSLRPVGVRHQQLSSIVPGRYENDGFLRFSFLLEDDDLMSRNIEIRILSLEGPWQTCITFPGVDSPYFAGPLWPSINGDTVRIDVARCFMWSLVAETEDGIVHSFDAPRKDTYAFPCPVVRATVTDCLFNDWSVSA